MTNTIEAQIDTFKPADLPTIGQRKRVKVNGKFEFLTVNALSVRRLDNYDTGKRRNLYRANITFGQFGDVPAA